jgi:hypothetical protein
MLSMALPVRRAGVLALAVAIALILTLDATPARADGVRDAQAWVLNAINAPAAWQFSQGQGVTVAVIDSGVNPDVSDLAGSVTTGPDLTGVGTPESNPGWGVHGTWMASLIAGHGHEGGGSGITGVAPKAHVLSIRVITDSADPGFSRYEHEPQQRIQRELARAIMYAVSHGAGVISMSLGYELPSLAVRQALGYALSHNVAVFASSGNSGNAPGARQRGHAPYSFPADYPGVLGVAAVGRNGAPAGFSSDNLSVQVAAPGISVPAQGRDGHYWLVSGTSPACALIAGVAALIRSAHPGLPPDLVREAISTTTTNRPRGGYDNEVGFGTVDAAAALTAAARLSAHGMAGPGAPRAGLRKTAASAPGLGLGSHFGGGPAAVPPEPVGPRGVGQLLLFCLLAACCLAMIVVATSRLILMRRPGALARDWRQEPVAPAATWPGLEHGMRAPGIPQRTSYRQAAPRFPWSASPPGRHAALRGRPHASASPRVRGFVPGSPAPGSYAPGSPAPGGAVPGGIGPGGALPRDFASADYGPGSFGPGGPSPRDFASADHGPGGPASGGPVPGGIGPGGSSPRDFASADHGPGNLAWGNLAPRSSASGSSTPGNPPCGSSVPGGPARWSASAGSSTLGNLTWGNLAPESFAPGTSTPGNLPCGSSVPGGSAPGSASPASSTPGNLARGSAAPRGSTPGSSSPGDLAWESAAPGGSEPGDVAPGSSAPGCSVPGSSAPEGSVPEDFAPGISPADSPAAENSAARHGE